MATKKTAKKKAAKASATWNGDEVLTTTEAAHVTKQSLAFMRDAIASGDIDGTPRRRVSGRGGFRVLHAAVIAWIARGMTPHPSKPAAGEP
jgi:hypothetical protein